MKDILILGATSDIAISLAKVYAENGYDLALASRRVTRLAPLKSDLEIRHNVKVRLFEFDANDHTSHDAFIQELGAVPGNLAVVFGYLGDHDKGLNDWTEAANILNTNYVSAVSITNRVANIYAARKEGNIIGISSVAGDRGRQSNYLYGSAKAGFTAYLSGLRNRLQAVGVHVMTVKPGFVATRMTEGMDLPQKLTSSSDHVARTIYKRLKGRKNVIYVSFIWRWIMLIIKLIPEPIFKKLKM